MKPNERQWFKDGLISGIEYAISIDHKDRQIKKIIISHSGLRDSVLESDLIGQGQGKHENREALESFLESK